jgi:very-short-patch-repair endonuclease
MNRKRASIDSQLADLAAAQHGVVSLAQLRDIGLRDDTARQRARRGRLHRIHRGVYAVGHARLSNEGRWMAAVLACAPDPGGMTDLPAALSHRTAAALWRLLPPSTAPVDVTVAGHGGRGRRAGIRLHRSVTLTRRHTTLRLGIPVTDPSRTLTDLRRCVSPRELDRAWRQAEVLGYPVTAVVVAERDPTRSELERRFRRLCLRHRLPSPEVNVRVGDYVVDFLWPEPRLIVETDGYRYHRGRAAFEDDHRRQAQLVVAGYELLRFTWRQVVDEPEGVIAAVRARLG